MAGSTELDQRRAAWIAAVNAGDLDAYADLVTEGLVWIPPAGEPLVGRAAFRAWLEPFMTGYRYDLSLEPAAVRVAGEWAGEAGRFRSVMTPGEGGEPMEHGSTYMVVWHRGADGLWRIDRYVDGIWHNSVGRHV